MAEEEIGVGVIGFGLAARVFHCPFVSAVPGLTLRSIVQRTGGDAAAAYPLADVVRSVNELLANPGISLVVVATPNETHFELARQVLQAGKHVVIDKPFAATSEEAAELIELAEAKGLVLAPFHNRRWDGDFLTLKKILIGGALGRVVTLESHFDRFRPVVREGTWKEAGHPANGLLFDLGPHLVDQALALFGVPKTVWASVRRDRDSSEIEDAFDICLGYPGLTVWCRSSMLACEPSPRFLVHGTHGSFRKYGVDPQEPALVAGAKLPRLGEPGEWLREDEAWWGTLTLALKPQEPGNLVRETVPTEAGDYRGYYANVCDAVLGKAQLEIAPEAGFAVIRVLELARQSSSTGKTLSL
jgi:scyllo-inositol 2-dehydrogenase (NADP+)